MGIVILDLPTVGQPNTTEDVKIRNNFQTLQNIVNGNLDASNLSPSVLSQLGNFQQAITARQVAEVGQVNNIRAGRVLTPTDFTNVGLSAPLGLWNLGNVNDSSGNARNLVNKGSVTFDTGITGAGAEAAVFTGSTGQALYIVDTGAADPFRIRTGSWGCWFRTAKRGVSQALVSKWGATAATQAWVLWILTSNIAVVNVGDGSTQPSANGTTDVCDDRWHFAVATYDGSKTRLYVDGTLEASTTFTGLAGQFAAPLNIGGQSADASTAAANPHYGRIDEAFITSDVLTEEQIRYLYCASIAHTLGTVPTGTRMAVRRRKRGGPLSAGNFPATPVRLHNFTAGALTDEGTGAVGLTSNPGTGAIVSVAGADGVNGGAYSFSGAHTGLSATDTGLPSGLAARSFGCWIKSSTLAAMNIIAWGTVSTADVRILATAAGALQIVNGADAPGVGGFITDGLWHQVVLVEDNTAVDLKRKAYLDGRLIGGSTTMNTVTLAGANRFRIGADSIGAGVWTGQIDGVFVYSGVLTESQVKTLYNVGSQQLAPSPKSDVAHIEALELTRVLGTFDSIEGTDLVDLAVIA